MELGSRVVSLGVRLKGLVATQQRVLRQNWASIKGRSAKYGVQKWRCPVKGILTKKQNLL